jgi:pimeloyl-ACP methyl ester carboxylesterase
LTFVEPDAGHQEVSSLGEQPRRPLLLYLPGAEQGEVLAARFQFQDLSRIYDLRQLRISASDRSSFAEMVSAVCEYLREHSGGAEEDAQAVLLGEGFGGMLALGVALHFQEELQGLVLVNPATSFDRSSAGKMLSNLPLQSIYAPCRV